MIGSSFFRPLPQPRNCFTLKIPQNYCMCQKIARVEINSEMGIKIAEKSIEMINNELIDNNFTDICVRHYLNNQTETQLIEYDNRGINGEKVVLVLFMTYPANARYGAHAL
uniref:ADF-H domain-containing protein n=2 Tax=Bursaphelenchus xylophilus TaxID=6326 RepID=A0A1I7SNX1_BURXY